MTTTETTNEARQAELIELRDSASREGRYEDAIRYNDERLALEWGNYEWSETHRVMVRKGSR